MRLRQTMYEKTVKLQDHEMLCKVNQKTGEITDLNTGKAPKNGMIKFNLMKKFKRMNTAAWDLLETQTTKTEYAVAEKLARFAKAYTSSLAPLNQESTAKELAETLKADRNTIKKIIERLLKLGVIGEFKVYDINEIHQKYWVFNPFLSFNGNVIKSDVPSLFDKTYYALVTKM